MAVAGDSKKEVVDDQSLTPLAQRFLWVENPESVLFAVKILAGFCALLFILDFIVHRHSYFSAEGWYGFYAIVGFLAFTLIVIAAKNLRRIILRSENYYAPDAVDAESYPEEGLDIEQFGHPHSDPESREGSEPITRAGKED